MESVRRFGINNGMEGKGKIEKTGPLGKVLRERSCSVGILEEEGAVKRKRELMNESFNERNDEKGNDSLNVFQRSKKTQRSPEKIGGEEEKGR